MEPERFAMNSQRLAAIAVLTLSPLLALALSLEETGIAGFVGPDGIGVSNGTNNYVNPAFAGWAAFVVQYAPAPGVAPEWTNATRALGPVTGNNMDVVSLGDLTTNQIAAGVPPGTLTLRMAFPICDKDGPDFAVFENSFGDAQKVFAELGYVEVSSDGTNFARFPCESRTPARVGAFGFLNPANVRNLVGKHLNAYGVSWGTPFDLAELTNHPAVLAGLVSLTNVLFVRVVDIPGSGDFLDDSTPPNPIYDPWLTAGSGGVDVEAVGILSSPHHARIWAQADGPGTVTPAGFPDGLVAVPLGSNVTFTFQPTPGYYVAEVRLGDRYLGRSNTVTLTDVQADARLTVLFGTSRGVPLSWLQTHGLTNSAPETAELSDDDHDNEAAWREFFAGTDPRQPDSVFSIVSVHHENGSNTVVWLGGTNGSWRPYRLEGARHPAGTWETLAPAVPRSPSGTNWWRYRAGSSGFVRIIAPTND